MSQVIKVNKIGKAYKVYPNRWSRFLEWISPLNKEHHELKWVLNDISFEIDSGQAVGIIGMNGAGKSTLLKILTGTTKPTKGAITTNAKIAALLELGMGFHPDFTGRQNVYMAGQLMGLTVETINRLMQEIEEFAEIGEYIDQQVRVYSSGMQMRLAFSVATCVRPDVLIVDEALSVGDTYFQHKSFEKIREFKKHGTTLLIVSHDKQAIQSICDHAILLNKGRIEKQGEPEMVMDYYNALLADKQKQKIEQVMNQQGKVQTISGTGEAVVDNIAIYNESGELVEYIEVGETVTLTIDVLVKEDIEKLVVGYGIKDRLGQVMYGTNTQLKKKPVFDTKTGERYKFEFQFNMNMGPGSYSIQTAIVSSDTHLVNNYEWRDLAYVFNVVNASHPHFEGVNWLDPEIEIKKHD